MPIRRPKGASKEGGSRQGTSRIIFVVYGRDNRLRQGLFTFLRTIGLNPKEWSQLTQATGEGNPYIGKILSTGFKSAQAVVVLLTPDDLARLRPSLVRDSDPEEERTFIGQPRPNVLFEAGMAFASRPKQTILVHVGRIRGISDLSGRHFVLMDDSVKQRQELANRLKRAGCPVELDGTDWHDAGDLSPGYSVAHQRKVLGALANRHYSVRSRTGIKKETGIAKSEVAEILGDLVAVGLAATKKTANNKTRWYITDAGRSALQ